MIVNGSGCTMVLKQAFARQPSLLDTPTLPTGKRPAKEDGRRAGPRTRDHEGDQRKKMVSARARRSQVGYANNRGISVRRARLDTSPLALNPYWQAAS